MTRDSTRLPAGVALRTITRLDCWRLSQRTLLPAECIGFVASKDGADLAAVAAVPSIGGGWWVCAWFLGDTARRYSASVYRIALMWLAGLKVAGIGPLYAIPDPGVSETWFQHLGFTRNGETFNGREVFEWAH
jgi:hypothetical protein